MPNKNARSNRNQQTKDAKQNEPNTEQAAKAEPVKAKHFRKTAKDQIEKNYKTIVEKLGKEAMNGSVRHTKLLFDLGGVKEEVEATSSKKKKGPSLGKLLIDEVKNMKQSKANLPEASSDQDHHN